MADRTWKAKERQIANWFGTVRNALSGGNSKQTRSDSLHPDLYIESKYSKRHAIWSLYEDTLPKAEAESKIPVLAISQYFKSGFLVVVHSSNFQNFAIQYLIGLGYHVKKIQNS